MSRMIVRHALCTILMLILLPALLFLGGCASFPPRDMPNTPKARACAGQAAAHAAKTVRAAPSPDYQMDWLGKAEDSYRACMSM